MSQNNSIEALDCSTLQRFSDFFQFEDFNVTDIVNACPDQCKLAWGSGNPDLSGIGVFFSYATQLALTILLGPLYACLVSAVSGRLRRYLFSVVVAALRSTALFASPIAIASMIVLNQQPSLFEIYFLYYVNLLEMLSWFAIYSSFIWGLQQKEAEGPDRKIVTGKDILLIVLGSFLQLVLILAFLEKLAEGKWGQQNIEEFVSSCSAKGMDGPGLPPVSALNDKTRMALCSLAYLAAIVAVSLFAVISTDEDTWMNWASWKFRVSSNPKFVAIGTAIASISGMESRPFPMAAYGMSKVMMHWFARKVHFDHPEITAFVLDPGFPQTDMGNAGAHNFGWEHAKETVEESSGFLVSAIDNATKEETSGHFPSIERGNYKW